MMTKHLRAIMEISWTTDRVTHEKVLRRAGIPHMTDIQYILIEKKLTVDDPCSANGHRQTETAKAAKLSICNSAQEREARADHLSKKLKMDRYQI